MNDETTNGLVGRKLGMDELKEKIDDAISEKEDVIDNANKVLAYQANELDKCHDKMKRNRKRKNLIANWSWVGEVAMVLGAFVLGLYVIISATLNTVGPPDTVWKTVFFTIGYSLFALVFSGTINVLVCGIFFGSRENLERKANDAEEKIPEIRKSIDKVREVKEKTSKEMHSLKALRSQLPDEET